VHLLAILEALAAAARPVAAPKNKAMQGNKSRDTKPELKVRRLLRDLGHPGYRLQWKKAPGKPDIAFPGRRIAIFVNGCFWHRCPRCDLPLPKTNQEYWRQKFARNVERDRSKAAELRALGWQVHTIWECELKQERELRQKVQYFFIDLDE
jgi:DNA mismatch endonuclease (patch repair protein)